MKKLFNKKGFTLMEMLIVVAIIVILVAISVPTFTANLDDAKSATDDANMRAAKSAAVIYDLENPIKSDSDKTVWYDADKGQIVNTKPTVGYRQVDDSATTTVDEKGYIIEIKYDDASSELKYGWVAP